MKNPYRIKKPLHIGFYNMKDIRLEERTFADDIVILENTEREPQHAKTKWNGILKMNKMTINKANFGKTGR